MESLDLIIRQLAEYFDVSVKFLQEHFMEYILEYGKYSLISNIWNNIISCLAIGAVAVVFSCVISYWIAEDFYMFQDGMGCFLYKYKKKITIIAVSAFTIVSLSLTVYHLTMYKVSPEIYSLKQVQQDFIKDKGE